MTPSKFPPRLAVDAEGYVWRVYDDGWSMAPSNPDNSPIPKPVTFYVTAAQCGGDGCPGCVHCWGGDDDVPPEATR